MGGFFTPRCAFSTAGWRITSTAVHPSENTEVAHSVGDLTQQFDAMHSSDLGPRPPQYLFISDIMFLLSMFIVYYIFTAVYRYSTILVYPKPDPRQVRNTTVIRIGACSQVHIRPKKDSMKMAMPPTFSVKACIDSLGIYLITQKNACCMTSI